MKNIEKLTKKVVKNPPFFFFPKFEPVPDILKIANYFNAKIAKGKYQAWGQLSKDDDGSMSYGLTFWTQHPHLDNFTLKIYDFTTIEKMQEIIENIDQYFSGKLNYEKLKRTSMAL